MVEYYWQFTFFAFHSVALCSSCVGRKARLRFQVRTGSLDVQDNLLTISFESMHKYEQGSVHWVTASVHMHMPGSQLRFFLERLQTLSCHVRLVWPSQMCICILDGCVGQICFMLSQSIQSASYVDWSVSGKRKNFVFISSSWPQKCQAQSKRKLDERAKKGLHSGTWKVGSDSVMEKRGFCDDFHSRQQKCKSSTVTRSVWLQVLSPPGEQGSFYSALDGFRGLISFIAHVYGGHNRTMFDGIYMVVFCFQASVSER